MNAYATYELLNSINKYILVMFDESRVVSLCSYYRYVMLRQYI